MFQPHLRVASVQEVTPSLLAELGLEAVLVDVDDTLLAARESDVDPSVYAWFATLRGAGVKVAILSNGTPARVAAIAAQAGVSDSSFSTIDERDARRIAASPGVSSVEGVVFNAVQVPKQGFLVVMGAHPAGSTVRRYKLLEGEPLQSGRDLLLGRTAAQNLSKSVGDTLRVVGTTFRIVGVFETGQAWEDGGAVITLREAQRLFGKQTYVKNPFDEPSDRSARMRAFLTSLPEHVDLDVLASDDMWR